MKNYLLLFCIFFLTSLSAKAQTIFPYNSRTKDYSGWTPAPQSDTNTVGMSGATVALPASVSAAESNPAGFAMETGSVSAQINRITVNDLRLQQGPINTAQGGLGISPPPWGFAFTYFSPLTENDLYTSPNTGHTLFGEASIKEFGLGISRVVGDRLALGVRLEMVKAVRELGGYGYNSLAPSFRLGALYRLEHHIVLGADYAPPLNIGPNSTDTPQTELPGFNRAVLRPSQLDLGVGWVPNRFFKIGTQLGYVGDTSNTALLSDQSVTTGSTPTLVPRIGASYVVADYDNFKSEWAIGSYFDSSRLSGRSDRTHATFAIEANPYFINLGIGFDLASDYHNYMMGIGIDIVRTARFFHIVPEDPTPHYHGILPAPLAQSADGMPDIMTPGEPRESKATSLGDVATIIAESPGNIAAKVTGKPTTVELRTKAEEEKKAKGSRPE